MPRKRPLKPPVAPVAEENLLRETPVPLTSEERLAFRAALKLPAFQKALRNIRLAKPSANIGRDALNGPLGAAIGNNRLHEIRGWEQFEVALGTQGLDPVITPPKAREKYQDESKMTPA